MSTALAARFKSKALHWATRSAISELKLHHRGLGSVASDFGIMFDHMELVFKNCSPRRNDCARLELTLAMLNCSCCNSVMSAYMTLLYLICVILFSFLYVILYLYLFYSLGSNNPDWNVTLTASVWGIEVSGIFEGASQNLHLASRNLIRLLVYMKISPCSLSNFICCKIVHVEFSCRDFSTHGNSETWTTIVLIVNVKNANWTIISCFGGYCRLIFTMSAAINDILHVMHGIWLPSCTWKIFRFQARIPWSQNFQRWHFLWKHMAAIEIFKISFAIIQCITNCSNAKSLSDFIAIFWKYRIQQLFLGKFLRHGVPARSVLLMTILNRCQPPYRLLHPWFTIRNHHMPKQSINWQAYQVVQVTAVQMFDPRLRNLPQTRLRGWPLRWHLKWHQRAILKKTLILTARRKTNSVQPY